MGVEHWLQPDSLRGGRRPDGFERRVDDPDHPVPVRAGFDMHLTKPLEPSELLVVIATLVEGVRGRRS